MTFENKGAMASTCVVAAQDSLNIAAANYVCTAGINDDVTIQEALNNYGEVVLLEGNYTPQANLTIPDDTCLRGQGFDTVITPTGGSITQAVIMGNRSILKSLKVILSGAAANADIVYASSKTQIWVKDVWLVGEAGSDSGIYFDTVTHSKIIDCRMDDNGDNGISLSGDSDYNTIAGNTCEGHTGQGIDLTDSDHNTIVGNLCPSNNSGIRLSTSCNNSIVGNVCDGNANSGTDCYTSCLGNTITGNTYQGNGIGLYLSTNCENNTLTGNTIQGNTQYSIRLFGSSNNNTITGNTVADNGYHGIFIESSDENGITGNQCDDNGAGGTYHGIYIYRSSYCSVTGNVCNNNLIDGINVFGDALGDSHYNTIMLNVCYNNGDDGIEIAGGADAVKNIVLGNQLTGNGGTALVDGGNATSIGHNITV